MRKIFVWALVLVLAMSLTACAMPRNTAGNTLGQPGKVAGSQNNHSGSAADSGERISEEQAQKIALEHANLTAEQVTGLRVSYDVDDGVPEYEVEFHHDHWEYEYEIHAQTGEIRSYDRDD